MLQQRAVLEQLNHSSLLLRKEKTLLQVCCFPVPFFVLSMHRSLLLWRLLVFVACRKCNDVYSPPRLVCIRLSAGSGREAGLLPRALVSLFRKLQGRLYGAMNLKPVMYHNVRELEPSEVRAEELRRNSLLKEVKKKQIKITLLLKKNVSVKQSKIVTYRMKTRVLADLEDLQPWTVASEDSPPLATLPVS